MEATALTGMRVGMRVQLHPATDAWMRGDKFGEIIKVTRHYVHVLCDRSGKVRKLSAANVLEVFEGSDNA